MITGAEAQVAETSNLLFAQMAGGWVVPGQCSSGCMNGSSGCSDQQGRKLRTYSYIRAVSRDGNHFIANAVVEKCSERGERRE